MTTKPDDSAPCTLGALARATGLARASLLHYEALGLLKPLARSAAGYRLYGAEQRARLAAIRRYRAAGLGLDQIAALLDAQPTRAQPDAVAVLEARLLALSDEVERLRTQQRALAQLLASAEFRARRPCRSKDAWVALLRRAGFDEDAMRRWHAEFEAASPKEHAAFLRALALEAKEVAAIRRWAKSMKSS